MFSLLAYISLIAENTDHIGYTTVTWNCKINVNLLLRAIMLSVPGWWKFIPIRPKK